LVCGVLAATGLVIATVGFFMEGYGVPEGLVIVTVGLAAVAVAAFGGEE
jgi:hypothetical protein